MLRKHNVLRGSGDIYVPARINFGEFILDKMCQNKDKDCLINGSTGETLSYGKILQHAMNLAISLARLGLRKGQTVAICSENRVEFFPTVIGVACTGAVLTVVNVGFSKDELKHMMHISKPEYVFCSPTTNKIHGKLFWSLGFIKKIILFGPQGAEKVPRTYLYTELVTPSKELRIEDVKYEEFDVKDVDGQLDTLFVMYTSGTAGMPKAVMLTHLNVIAACCLTTSHHPDASTLSVSPWYNSVGLLSILIAMAYNRSFVYLAKFDIELYLKTIEKYKIEHLEAVPSILMALGNSDLSIDTSSVKIVSSIGATLHPATIRALKEKLANARTATQAYSMTETTTNIIRYDEETLNLAKPGALGYLVAGCTAKVVHYDTRNPVKPNQDGELCIKGALVTKGYIEKDKTIDFDREGFMLTGDIVYYDADEMFYFVDRAEDMIKYKDDLLSPTEMEAILLEHEAVTDAAVVGIEDPSSGKVPMAFVVTVNPNNDVSEDQLILFVAKRMPEFNNVLGGVQFVDQIPRNQSGKILRKQLRNCCQGR